MDDAFAFLTNPAASGDWLVAAQAIEAFEDAPLDAALVSRFQGAARAGLAPIRFSTPTFKEYSTDGRKGLRQEFVSRRFR